MTEAPTRGYHHGDLANALVEAATRLARAGGGAEAIVLREAARAVGVSPTAAYRHFASHADLVSAVKERALDQLGAAMRAGATQVPATDDPAADAAARVLATGRAYVQFALTEPGLFRVAFDRRDRPVEPAGPGRATRAFGVLVEEMDRLVATGRIRAEQRPYAEFAAWSAAHGLAVLLLDGPLRLLPEQERDRVIERTFDTVIGGL